MNINDTGLTNNPNNLRELARDPEHLKKLVALWADNTFVHHLAAELLAVREAQSVEVSETELNDALRLHHLKTDGHSQLADSFRNGFKYARRTAPPAPAVPDAVDYSDLDATSQDREVIEAIAECKGWNACRAEMIRLSGNSEPVSQGYTLPAGFKLVPNEPTPAIENAISNGIYHDICPAGIYADVLAAAPTPTK